MTALSILPAAETRRLRLFNLGLPRTGTKSIAALYSGFRSAHEFQFQGTIQQLLTWKQGRTTEGAMRDFIRTRDQAGQLEVDAAFFHHYYLDFLIEEYQDARFIVTVRDAYSWINSFVDMLVRWRRHYQLLNQPLPQWQVAYGKFLFKDFDPDLFANPGDLRTHFKRIAGSLIECWAGTNRRMLELLPTARTFVLRTSDISRNLKELADFSHVEYGALISSKSLVNEAPYRFDWTGTVDSTWLAQLISNAGSQRLTELFAEVSPASYAIEHPGAGDWEAYLERHQNFRLKNYGTN